MPFSQRNIFYLRTSPHVVLQTILYLDPRDLKWMNSRAHRDGQDDDDEEDELDGEFGRGEEDECIGDAVWSRALSQLKPKIMPKLRAESIEGDILSSTNKKEKVDVHIEPDFQMAYFFRKVGGKHAVLLKEKELRFPAGVAVGGAGVPDEASAMGPPSLPASVVGKSSNTGDLMPTSRLAARQSNQTDNVLFQGSRIANEEREDEEEEDVKPAERRGSGDEEMEGERTGLPTMDLPVRIKEEDDDDVVLVEEPPVSANVESIDVDAMEDDKKPRLHVKYSGFKIFGKCFIVVIEPTKRTKRLRPSLFQTSTPTQRHQLSATPMPRQSRETPDPSAPTSHRQSLSLARTEDGEDEQEREYGRGDSRRDRLSAGLFRGTPSQWTPTPEPESQIEQRQRQEDDGAGQRGAATTTTTTTDLDMDADGEDPESGSVMLATQMLQGGSTGQGNDIDDD